MCPTVSHMFGILWEFVDKGAGFDCMEHVRDMFATLFGNPREAHTVFKMQFPEIVDRSADANKFATVNKEDISHVLGKLTLDTTQFFPLLVDSVLGDFGRFFVVNRDGAIISSAVLEDQIQIVGQGLYGDKSNLAFKKIWQVEGFQYVTASHFTTSDTLVDGIVILNY